MANFSERPWEMRNRDQDSFQFRTQQPPTAPSAVRRGRGGSGPAVDMGTVALAISGMTFYWVLPIMMGGRLKQRSRQQQAPESE